MSEEEFVTKTISMSAKGPINRTIVQQIGDLCKAQSLALHHWQGVEDALGIVFKALMRSPNPILPFAALAAVQFESKLRVVEQTLLEALKEHPDAVKKWGTIKNKAQRTAKLRNSLAHSRIEMFGDDYGMTWRLYPAATNIGGLRKYHAEVKPGSVLDEPRISSFICSFQILEKRLTDFAGLVEGLLPSPDRQ